MRWSYVLFLPAMVSAAWALATPILKRHPTRAQVVLSLMLLIEAVTITVLGIFFRGRDGQLFIYDFMFEILALVCAPMYYVGICAHTEARGATLEQRRVFFIPLLFIIGLTIGSFWLGPRRYEMMCYAILEGNVSWIPGDAAWNFMLFWDHWLFPALLVIMSFILILAATFKIRKFQKRYNSYYAEDMNTPFFNSRGYSILAWMFLPLAAIAFVAIDFRPFYYKYWLIVCALLLTVVQFVTGHFTYRMNYDARTLAEYIRNKNIES
ncbi:MAG: hypothetical protein IKR83_05495 [Bacteroidales bacterium]|nr:hypothetical protein [Bacteroidales bacterium]